MAEFTNIHMKLVNMHFLQRYTTIFIPVHFQSLHNNTYEYVHRLVKIFYDRSGSTPDPTESSSLGKPTNFFDWRMSFILK